MSNKPFRLTIHTDIIEKGRLTAPETHALTPHYEMRCDADDLIAIINRSMNRYARRTQTDIPLPLRRDDIPRALPAQCLFFRQLFARGPQFNTVHFEFRYFTHTDGEPNIPTLLTGDTPAEHIAIYHGELSTGNYNYVTGIAPNGCDEKATCTMPAFAAMYLNNNYGMYGFEGHFDPQYHRDDLMGDIRTFNTDYVEYIRRHDDAADLLMDAEINHLIPTCYAKNTHYAHFTLKGAGYISDINLDII